MKAFVKDNRGVTLVELMIAVIIFAIITIPLLNSFKVATMTAAKSEQLGRVSMAAQNIAQRIQASDISTLISNAEKAKDALGADTAIFYKKNGANWESVSTFGASPYYIWLEGVSSGVSTYNALVEIAPSDGDINDKELTVYTPMTFFGDVARPDDTTGIAFREITLTVTKDAANIVDVEISTGSRVKTEEEVEEGSKGTKTEGDETPEVGQPAAVSEEPVPAQPRGVPVELGKSFSIYLLYTPVYGDDITDEITIVNEQNLDFDLFLVKKHEVSGDKPYNCIINQQVNDINGSLADIYTNVKDQMGSGVIAVTYTVNAAPVATENDLKCDALVIKEREERAYNFTVKLFPADAGFDDEPLYELKSMSID